MARQGRSALNGETIIYFGPEPWEGMWRNRHQLMSRLAKRNRVVYVEPAISFRPAWDVIAGKDKSYQHGGRVTQHSSGVVVYRSPWWTPLTGRKPFRQWSLWLYFKVMSRLCNIERDCKPIIWLSRPTMRDYLGKLNEKVSVYHVVDEYTAYAGVDEETRDWLIDQERGLAGKADAVIVVTPALEDSKSPYNEHTYLVPNAVDYTAYAISTTHMPLDIAKIRKPVIGFTGLVSARVDFELLGKAARKKPDWSFVFVGSINSADCREELRTLDALANVHFLGMRPVQAMPSYLQAFDVCTIPYADDDSAANASPLKLYEYAAARKPIVTTDFAAAREFPGHLSRVTSTTGFLRACEKALETRADDSALEENQQFAAENTWEHRVDQVIEILQEHMPRDEF